LALTLGQQSMISENGINMIPAINFRTRLALIVASIALPT
jgi:hypothetical protein